MSNLQTTINSLAKSLYERFGNDINRAEKEAKSEFNQFYTAIIREVDILYKGKSEHEYQEYCDNMSNAFYAVMRKYDPQRGNFWNLFIRSLSNKVKTSFDKQNKENERKVSLDDDISNDTDGLTIADSVADKFDQTEKAVNDAGIEAFHLALIDYCMTKKKTYSTSKKFNYKPIFFTDQTVREIINREDDIIIKVIKRNNYKFNEAADIAFLNTFVDKHCDELLDACKCGYLPLSVFTGKENDADKSCCAKNPPYAVILSYLDKAYNMAVTASALKQQSDKYLAEFNRLKKIWLF